MSAASASAHVRIVLADYISVDSNNKITIVGGGITIAASNSDNGLTAQFGVIASVSFDPQFIRTSPAIVLSLETEAGDPVLLTGDEKPFRLESSNRLNPTRLPDFKIPKDVLRPKAQIHLQFQNGLPLPAGQAYKWRITVDDETRDEWTERLYIAAPG